MKSFITGINGFVGHHLTKLLHEKGHEVVGLDIANNCSIPNITYFQIDLTNKDGINSIIKTHKPDHVYHLAALSYVPDSDKSPLHAIEINLLGTIYLIESIREFSKNSKLLIVGSSKIYGSINSEIPVSESDVPHSEGFYAITKYCGELVGTEYAKQFGLDIRFTRSFNHTGPGQSPRFVCSDWAKQVAEIIKKVNKPEILVGDIDQYLDFTDVRDVVEAYYAILEKGKTTSVYNVCSGKMISLQFILDYLCTKANTPIKILKKTEKIRSGSIKPKMVGDNSKILRDTGWAPSIEMTKTLDDLLQFWLTQESI